MYKLSKATNLRTKSNSRSQIEQKERIIQDQPYSIISGDTRKLIKQYLKTSTETNQNKRSERVNIRNNW